MKIYFAIDGGTTNTRVNLVADGIITDTIKINIGARKSIGGNSELKEAVKKAICDLLKKHNLSEDD